MGSYDHKTPGDNPYGTIGHNSAVWEAERRRAAQEQQAESMRQHQAHMDEVAARNERMQRDAHEREQRRREKAYAEQQEKDRKQALKQQSAQKKKSNTASNDSSVFKFSFGVAIVVFAIVALVMYGNDTAGETSLIVGGVVGVLIGFLWRVILGLAIISGVIYVVYLVIQSQ